MAVQRWIYGDALLMMTLTNLECYLKLNDRQLIIKKD